MRIFKACCRRETNLALWTAYGIAMGTALGSAIGNLGLGIGIGMLASAGIQVARLLWRKSDREG